MSSVTLRNVFKRYDNTHTAVHDLNLTIQDKEFMVLVGPSGCGKTTTMRMIAGLEDITQGDVLIGERRVNDLSPKDRDIAMVFQNYALYPHMSVYDNMAFGLKLRKVPKDDIKRRVQETARLLDIQDYLPRKPKALSGGQRQRVALGRAIVREPAVFLMDEPLSNLDAQLRVQTRAELIKLHRRLGITTVYVTHDQVEAMTMGDRIAVMRDGVLQQCARPLEVYSHPVNTFVAAFIGTPSMNLLGGVVERVAGGIEGGGGYRINCGSFVVPGPSRGGDVLGEYVGKAVVWGVRPSDLLDRGMLDKGLQKVLSSGSGSVLRGLVEVYEPMGSVVTLYLRVGDQSLVATIDAGTSAVEGGMLDVFVDVEKTHVFDAQTQKALF